MESKRSRVSGSSNQSERDKDTKGKDGENIKLASTQKCQRDTKVFRPGQLLQEVYKRLYQDSCTTTCTSVGIAFGLPAEC